MLNDLDTLMQQYGVDALFVTGAGRYNPAMVYLTGGAQLTDAYLVKPRGREAVLYCLPMEREEAARSGLKTVNIAHYSSGRLLAKAGGDRVKARALLMQRMLADAGVSSGKIALYGRTEIGPAMATFTALKAVAPELEWVSELDQGLIHRAMATKEPKEVEHIRSMGAATTAVVGQVADLLSSCQVRGDTLLALDGEPLTIGAVKHQINLWLAQRGAENPEGTIFALGRDAGIPHSAGRPDQPLQTGLTLVFDIYPREEGGGYFYDFTRTWCLGYAPEAVAELYEQVHSAYRRLTAEMHAGQSCAELQNRACDIFEGLGHASGRSDPLATHGFVHGLGHGVGLNIHEKPWFGATAESDDRLIPGTVFTIEPGLYYPERGMGVRLEDTWYVRPDGSMEVLADYPMELVLPLPCAA
jgi:Xaa-Pro aminopeptidase